MKEDWTIQKLCQKIIERDQNADAASVGLLTALLVAKLKPEHRNKILEQLRALVDR